MGKHQNDCQINYQQSSFIWRFNSLASWNIQREISLLLITDVAQPDSKPDWTRGTWELAFDDQLSNMRPFSKSQSHPQRWRLAATDLNMQDFEKLVGMGDRWSTLRLCESTKRLNGVVLIPLCAKRQGKLETWKKSVSLSLFLSPCQLVPFGGRWSSHAHQKSHI